MTVLYVCACGYEKVIEQTRVGERVARPDCRKAEAA